MCAESKLEASANDSVPEEESSTEKGQRTERVRQLINRSEEAEVVDRAQLGPVGSENCRDNGARSRTRAGNRADGQERRSQKHRLSWPGGNVVGAEDVEELLGSEGQLHGEFSPLTSSSVLLIYATQRDKGFTAKPDIRHGEHNALHQPTEAGR